MLKTLIRRKVKSEEGQALLEFALVLPLILMILCGILDFGWLFYNQLNVDNSAREAARAVCVVDCQKMTADEVKGKAVSVVERNLFKPSMLQKDGDVITGVVVEYLSSEGNVLNEAQRTQAEMVCVKVKIDMPVLTFVLHAICRGDTREVSSSATFKIEKSNAEVNNSGEGD